jgi:hypothetical protein
MRSALEQFAASLASIFAVLGIAGAMVLGAWLIAKWLGRVGRPDLRAYDASPWGDYPAIPAEAKAATSERFVAGGGSKAEAGRRGTEQDTSLRTGTGAQ